jgi:hypothetical protein
MEKSFILSSATFESSFFNLVVKLLAGFQHRLACVPIKNLLEPTFSPVNSLLFDWQSCFRSIMTDLNAIKVIPFCKEMFIARNFLQKPINIERSNNFAIFTSTNVICKMF